jgi:hypothetical protein
MKSLLPLIILYFVSHLSIADDLYRITLVRATPGSLAQVIEQASNYKAQQKGDVSIMRHSQGDHWDLMMLEPAGEDPLKTQDFSVIADFQHSFLAKSNTSWQQLKARAQASGLFHIEMFHALHGKANELLKQRAMENQYLSSTQRQANVIFETTFGSDVDSFTIGYYSDLAAFAAMPDLKSEVFSKAATDAGFKSRNDIGLYLRELIVAHHDTLATRVD